MDLKQQFDVIFKGENYIDVDVDKNQISAYTLEDRDILEVCIELAMGMIIEKNKAEMMEFH